MIVPGTILATLVAVEWGAETDMEEGGTEPSCPLCDGARRLGHEDGCSLAGAIRDLSAEVDATDRFNAATAEAIARIEARAEQQDA